MGVHALGTGSGHPVTPCADGRFAQAVTFKALQAAVVLRRCIQGPLRKKVTYSRADPLEYAPVTFKHLATGMTVGELLAASLQYSDNTAANLKAADGDLVDNDGVGPAVLEDHVDAGQVPAGHALVLRTCKRQEGQCLDQG